MGKKRNVSNYYTSHNQAGCHNYFFTSFYHFSACKLCIILTSAVLKFIAIG